MKRKRDEINEEITMYVGVLSRIENKTKFKIFLIVSFIEHTNGDVFTIDMEK